MTTITPYSRTDVLAEIRRELTDHADHPADAYNVEKIARECYREISPGTFLPAGKDGGAARVPAEVDRKAFWPTVDAALLTRCAGHATTSADGLTLLVRIFGHDGRTVDEITADAPGTTPEMHSTADALRPKGWAVVAEQGAFLLLDRI